MPDVTFRPSGKTVTVRPGTTLLAAGWKAGAGIRTRCGGMAGCLMCKVRVLDPHAVSPMKDMERRKLGEDAAEGIRLSCQTQVIRDVAVEVPEDPLKAAVRRQLERQNEEETLW